MSRATLILNSDPQRVKAIAWINQAPWNTRLEFKGPRRSLPQNDRMWAMLTDVATQVLHHGQRLTAEDWKFLFLAQLKTELRMVPNLDNTGWVTLGRSSSDLTKSEMSAMIELIFAYGAAHGVQFHDEESGEEPNKTSPSSAEFLEVHPSSLPNREAA
jgi:hypothetical protein